MKFSFASPNDENNVKKILQDNDLHHQDITASHLEHFLLLGDGAELVGVVGLEIKENCALLRSLAVSGSYRKKGLASQLVRKIEELANAHNVDTLYLLTVTAESFFTNRGYQKTDRRAAPPQIQETEEFKNLCPASAVCMVKHLNPKSFRK